MKFSSFSFSHVSSNHLQLWTPPITRSQLAPSNRNNLGSDWPIIPLLASNHPLAAPALLHLNFKLSTKREKGFCCGVIPEGSLPLPPDPPSDHWKSWLVGVLITALLPFLKNKLGTLLKLRNVRDEVETAIEAVDRVMEVAEDVAEEVEKVAETVAEQTPVGSRLHDAAASVENVAKEVARDAHLADDVLDKMEEVEKELESLVEPVVDESNNIAD